MIVDAKDSFHNTNHEGVIMEKKQRYGLVLSIPVLVLAGCSEVKTARILEEDQAQMAITLNKGYGTTVIAVNDGQRIEPCALVSEATKQQVQKAVEPCDPDEGDAEGEVLFEEHYKVTVREGSICITVMSGSRKYRFCDPPYNLGF
jgi:hypothetical protein